MHKQSEMSETEPCDERVFGYRTTSFSSFEASQTLHHVQGFADLHPHSQNLHLEVLSGYLTLI